MSNVADFEVVEWCMCENEVVRVLRMVGCECSCEGSCVGYFRGQEWVLVLIFSVVWPSISC